MRTQESAWQEHVTVALFLLSRKAGWLEAKRQLWSSPVYAVIRKLLLKKESATVEYVREVEKIHKRYDRIWARYRGEGN